MLFASSHHHINLILTSTIAMLVTSIAGVAIPPSLPDSTNPSSDIFTVCQLIGPIQACFVSPDAEHNVNTLQITYFKNGTLWPSFSSGNSSLSSYFQINGEGKDFMNLTTPVLDSNGIVIGVSGVSEQIINLSWSVIVAVRDSNNHWDSQYQRNYQFLLTNPSPDDVTATFIVTGVPTKFGSYLNVQGDIFGLQTALQLNPSKCIADVCTWTGTALLPVALYANVHFQILLNGSLNDNQCSPSQSFIAQKSNIINVNHGNQGYVSHLCHEAESNPCLNFFLC